MLAFTAATPIQTYSQTIMRHKTWTRLHSKSTNLREWTDQNRAATAAIIIASLIVIDQVYAQGTIYLAPRSCEKAFKQLQAARAENEQAQADYHTFLEETGIPKSKSHLISAFFSTESTAKNFFDAERDTPLLQDVTHVESHELTRGLFTNKNEIIAAVKKKESAQKKLDAAENRCIQAENHRIKIKAGSPSYLVRFSKATYAKLKRFRLSRS